MRVDIKDERRLEKTIRFEEDAVVKTQGEAYAEVEFAKTVAAKEAAGISRSFDVPSVRSFDLATGTMVLERMPHLVPLYRGMRQHDDPRRLAARAGVALAAIHQHLDVPDCYRNRLPMAFDNASLPQGWLHGDFNSNNVCLDSESGDIVVLDWAASDVIGGQATYGPQLWDAWWMTYDLLINNLLYRTRTRKIFQVVDAFLMAYLSHHHAYGADRIPLVKEYFLQVIAAIRSDPTMLSYVYQSRSDRLRLPMIECFVRTLSRRRLGL
jgi:hypothetical protein